MKIVKINFAVNYVTGVAITIALLGFLISLAAPKAWAQSGWVVGQKGTLLYSKNGDDWETQGLVKGKPMTDADLKAVHAWNPRTACAVGTVAKMGKYANKATILCTTNAGNDWELKDSGVRQNLNSVYFADSKHVWAVGDKGTVIYSDSSGNKWGKPPKEMTLQSTEKNLYGVAFFIDNNHGCIVGDVDKGRPFIEYMKDGKNWNLGQPTPLKPGFPALSVSSVSFKAVPAENAERSGSLVGWIVGGSTFGAWESKNGGATWKQSKLERKEREDLLTVQVLSKEHIWAAGESPNVVRTPDEGKTWTSVPVKGKTTVRGLAFLGASTGWAVGTRTVDAVPLGVIYKTENGDKDTTWTLKKSTTDGELYGIVILAKQEVKLDQSTNPDSGSAGTNYLSVRATGLPDGPINPANVVVKLGTDCHGATSATSAVSLVSGSGDSKSVSFLLPSGLATGQYFVSISDSEEGDANFESSNCSAVNVAE